jgi:hypothetical protein
MLSEVTASELTEWQAYSEVEPWGPVVDDLRAGMGAAATLNMNRSRDADPIGPLELFPWNRRDG